MALDAVGLIPEAEGFTKVYENMAGNRIPRSAGNSLGHRGSGATQQRAKAVTQGKGAIGLLSGALGLGDTSVAGRISTGATLAGFIPGVGAAAAGVSLGVDAYRINKETSACVASGKYD